MLNSGSKLVIFLSHVTLNFHRWPWKPIGLPRLCYIKPSASFQSHQWIQSGVAVRKLSIWVKLGDSLSVWRHYLTDDLEKQQDTSVILCQTLCVISKSSVNSIWSCSPETLNLGQIGRFFVRVTSKFHRWPWKTIGHLSETTSSSVYHVDFCPVWLWNSMEDLEKRQGTSS